MDPKYVKSYYRKTKALVNSSKLEEAKTTIEEALKIEPDNEDCKQL